MRKVFLSSTAKDLADYREAIYRTIEGMDGYHGVRMEDFGARHKQPDEFFRTRIADCDLAVFIAGLCYGSSPSGSQESYNAREYRAAAAVRGHSGRRSWFNR